MYIRKEGATTIIAVYVDDLILITKTAEEMSDMKSILASRFKMTDMGELHYCLGVTIERSVDCLWLHQKQYISSMLKKYGMSEAAMVSTPADISVKLEKDDGQSKDVNSSIYQSMVGSLLYAAMATRPDIAQAVGVVSKFNSKPTQAHQTAVKRILRYLKGTMDLALRYSKSDDGAMVGYSDSDWAGDPDDRHSTTGRGSRQLAEQEAIDRCTVHIGGRVRCTKLGHTGGSLAKETAGQPHR